MIKFRRVKEDDLICDLKAGDIVVVDENYDWDPDKCILIGKVIIDKVLEQSRNKNLSISMYI
jgi:hypothetical protein